MSRSIELDPLEARVLGVLVEKELTTPDQYPLSENALTSGCNQKSNRDPVMDLSLAEVRLTIEGLRLKGLVGATHQAGGRVERYHHSARPVLGVDGTALAVLTELLLRGAQSPGELRARVSRMSAVGSLPELTRELEALESRGLVRRLAPLPGSRAARYEQLLCSSAASPVAETPAVDRGTEGDPVGPPAARPGLEARVAAVENEVARLRRSLDGLAARLGEDLSD